VLLLFLAEGAGLAIGVGIDLAHNTATTIQQLPARRSLPADSLVLDRYGGVVADLHPPGESRIPVQISRIATVARDATVAVEDRQFWDEGVIAPSRVAAAGIQDIWHGRAVQGASTITAQLARILYLDQSKTAERKLREISVGQRLLDTMSKEQILGEYLNDVYYGRGATGIQAAARIYFGIDASALDLAQASMLAGLPSAPTELNPLTNPEAARWRQGQVLAGMVKAGYISDGERQAAQAEGLQFATGPPGQAFATQAPAFVARVEAAVATLTRDPARDGLTVVTTLDLQLQQAANEAVREEVDRLQASAVGDGAAISVDPGTGEVRAYVGSSGPGHPGSELDILAQARQPAITFSMFTYAAALEQGRITLETPLVDAPYGFIQGGGADGTAGYDVAASNYHGVVAARVALAGGFKTPALKVQGLVGAGTVIDMAKRLGASSLDRRRQAYGQSLSLGTYSMPMIELAQAGATIAGGGVMRPLRFIQSVRDASGHELWPVAGGGSRVIGADVADSIAGALTATPGRAVIGGTSSDLADSVTLGWDSALVTMAWVGNADATPMLAAPSAPSAHEIWRRIMDVSSARLGRDAAQGLRGQLASALVTINGPSGVSQFPVKAAASSYTHNARGIEVTSASCGQKLQATPGFSIIGVNAGKPFTQNPCLGSLLAAGSERGPLSLYLIAGYRREYATRVTGGCASSSQRVGTIAPALRMAWAIGCSEASEAMTYASQQHHSPAPTWWINVEAPYTDSLAGANWSIDHDLNRQVIAGALYSLQAGGATAGVHSSAPHWSLITGDWVIPDPRVPDWVGGSKSIESTCHNVGFSGGPVWLVRLLSNSKLDGDRAC
jgi:membrane peptidoglycan carboxypeptidase